MQDCKETVVLREKYKHLHPLILHRSVEYATTVGDLFEILDSFPIQYPVIWDEKEHRWKTQKDVIRVDQLRKIVDSSKKDH
jgi:hypothetical protein